MDPFEVETFECCAAPDLSRRPLVSQRVVHDGLLLVCRRCYASRPVYRVHFIWRMRHTACCLELDGAVYRTTLQPTATTCDDCVWMLVHELAAAPLPDWRPAFAIAEDHYAL